MILRLPELTSSYLPLEPFHCLKKKKSFFIQPIARDVIEPEVSGMYWRCNCLTHFFTLPVNYGKFFSPNQIKQVLFMNRDLIFVLSYRMSYVFFPTITKTSLL